MAGDRELVVAGGDASVVVQAREKLHSMMSRRLWRVRSNGKGRLWVGLLGMTGTVPRFATNARRVLLS